MLRKYTYVYLGGCLGKFSRRHYSAQMVQFKPSAISDDYVIGQLALSLSSFFCLFFFFRRAPRRNIVDCSSEKVRDVEKFGLISSYLGGCQRTKSLGRQVVRGHLEGSYSGFRPECLVMWNGNYLWGGGGVYLIYRL